MKPLYLLMAIACLSACGGNDNSATDDTSNSATELRDWAKSHTSKAEVTAQLAEAKMALRLIEQTDPQSSEAKELKAKIEKLEKDLEDLKQNARQ